MKIIFDKTKNNYQYPVNHKDLKRLFSIIPEQWKIRIKLVHFLGQEPFKSEFDRPVIKSFSRINLSVIGLTEEEIIKEILIELRQDSSFGENLRAASFNSLSKAQRKRIEEIIQPYVDKYFELKRG